MLRLHQDAHRLGQVGLGVEQVDVARLHAGDDVPAHEEVGDVVRVWEARILGLYVVQPGSELDVVVEPDDRGS